MSNKLPNIEILLETDDYVVVNKPAGLMVHSDGRAIGPFLTDWIVNKYPEAKGVGDPARTPDGKDIDRSGIVHRLDRDTSGALLVVKNNKTHKYFKERFENRDMTKKYLAFVWGRMKDEFGTINRPIGRNGSDFRKWSAQRGARGELREAETYWTLYENVTVDEPKNEWERAGFALVIAEPKTGRTHQIRVHMNAINHPIVGDMLYSPKKPVGLGFMRPALHAWKLQFEDMNGKKQEVTCPLPEDFERAINEAGIVLDSKKK